MLLHLTGSWEGAGMGYRTRLRCCNRSPWTYARYFADTRLRSYGTVATKMEGRIWPMPWRPDPPTPPASLPHCAQLSCPVLSPPSSPPWPYFTLPHPFLILALDYLFLQVAGALEKQMERLLPFCRVLSSILLRMLQWRAFRNFVRSDQQQNMRYTASQSP